MNTLRSLLRAGALALAVALLAACGSNVKNPVTGRTERTVMDERAELAEGKKGHQEVLKEYTPLANPALQAYVNEIGQRLAKASHRPELPWTFTVLDSPEVNAFALPGGYIYITRGIMAYLNSEADLAGVLGHEIGHVTARHGAQRATRAQNAGLGVLAATVLGAVLESKGMGGAGDLASTLSQTAAAGYVARYSREQELQADQLGAEYLSRVNYDPKNMVDVIQVLKDQDAYRAQQARAEGRAVPEGDSWLASHPSSDERLRQIMQRAQAVQAQRANTAFADEARARYMKAIDGIPFGESREQGVTRGRSFYHEPLGFAFTAPQGWRIVNDSEAVTVVSGAGDVAMQLRALPSRLGTNHDDIIRNAVKPESGRVQRVNLASGLEATRFVGTQRTPQGQVREIRLTLVTGPNKLPYVLQYLGKDSATVVRAWPQLEPMEDSFRALTAADRSAARPWVLRTLPMPAGGIDALARRSPLGQGGEGQIRLLNQAYADQAALPRAGTMVKTIEAAP
jgi:predicted Zn-dependent protease